MHGLSRACRNLDTAGAFKGSTDFGTPCCRFGNTSAVRRMKPNAIPLQTWNRILTRTTPFLTTAIQAGEHVQMPVDLQPVLAGVDGLFAPLMQQEALFTRKHSHDARTSLPAPGIVAPRRDCRFRCAVASSGGTCRASGITARRNRAKSFRQSLIASFMAIASAVPGVGASMAPSAATGGAETGFERCRWPGREVSARSGRPESGRRRQELQPVRHLPGKAGRHRFGAGRGAHRHRVRRASLEQVRPQRGHGRQEGRNRHECTEKIADPVRQLAAAGEQALGRGEIRKTADRGPAVAAIQPGNAHRNRRLPPAGPVTHQPAAACATASRAGRKACVPPLLAAGMLLGGRFFLFLRRLGARSLRK